MSQKQYHKGPMFLDIPDWSGVWANSVDIDQTALRSNHIQGGHCLPFCLHLLDLLLLGKTTLFKMFRIITLMFRIITATLGMSRKKISFLVNF